MPKKTEQPTPAEVQRLKDKYSWKAEDVTVRPATPEETAQVEANLKAAVERAKSKAP